MCSPNSTMTTPATLASTSIQGRISSLMALAEAPRATKTVEKPSTKKTAISTTRRVSAGSLPAFSFISSKLVPAM